MKPSWLACALLPLALPQPAVELATTYTADQKVRVAATTTFSMATVEFEMFVNGEPVEGHPGMGGSESSESRSIEFVDTWHATQNGLPTKVERAFETLSAEASTTSGDQGNEIERESPLNGVTLMLVKGETGLEITVADGAAPDEALVGHTLELALDGLLPDGDVAIGGTWDIDKDAIFRALGIDLEETLFPQPEREEARGEGGHGGGLRGGRGARSPFAPFAELEWTGKATLTETGAEHDGHSCVVITLEFEGDGTLEQRQRGREQRAFGLAPRDTDFGVQLEGTLWFSNDVMRPLELELEGQVTSDRHDTFERGDMSREMVILKEGQLSHTVRITAESTSDGK